MTCLYCGRSEMPTHPKYKDKCVECGKDYHNYKSYQSMQRKNPTLRRQVLIDRMVEDYKQRYAAGFKVPRDITKA